MPPDEPGAGNRFDSLAGNYTVLYCATDVEGCYAETLARFRVDPHLADVVRDEWDQRGWMRVGNVPRSWRTDRCAVEVTVDPAAAPFLDVEDADTRAFLEHELRIPLTYFGVEHLDVPVIRGEDRRVTRLVSQWAWSATNPDGDLLYAGIRYLSKVDTEQECWAIFPGVEVRELARHRIRKDDPDLQAVARRFGLTLH